MSKVKLLAINIDGILLEDTFSPVFYRLAKKYNVEYTRNFENNVLSQNRLKAAEFLKMILNLPENLTIEQITEEFFEERRNFLQEEPLKNHIMDGGVDFIHFLKKQNFNIVCYGGLAYEEIETDFIPYLNIFDQYICTNDFRPGLKEIVHDIYDIDFNEALFIDDVNNVAMEAKKYNIPFIGLPSKNLWSFQKSEMKKNNVKYIVDSLKEITINYLERVLSDTSIWI